MAGELSKEDLGSVLMQAMLAQKILAPQHDHLLQVQSRLQQQLKPSDDSMAAELRGSALDHRAFAAKLNQLAAERMKPSDDSMTADLRESALDVEHTHRAFAARLNELAAERLKVAVAMKQFDLASELSKVYYIGIKSGARPLATCLDLAATSGARSALNPEFAAMPDEQLYDALVAQPLPACPTTQTEAFSRVEAALYAVKLADEQHLPSCIEHLSGIPTRPVTDEPEDEEHQVDAATEHLAKTDLSDPAPAAAATGEHPQAVTNISVDVDKARDYLDRACTLASLAVKHIDLAVAIISGFLDPEEVASHSEFTDGAASIFEDHFLLF